MVILYFKQFCEKKSFKQATRFVLEKLFQISLFTSYATSGVGKILKRRKSFFD